MFASRRESIVYLTADSPNELDALREEDVYIIGGIVDRNRHKARASTAQQLARTIHNIDTASRGGPQNLTLELATRAGVRHARLPIQAHVKMAGSHVLTVNQVVELLLAWLELRDWRAACERAVPRRKRGDDAAGGAAGEGAEPDPEGDGEDEGDDDKQARKVARVTEDAAGVDDEGADAAGA